MRTVSVELYNRSVYFNGTFAKRRLWKYFRFRPRNYRFMPLYKDGRWDGWIKLFNSRYNSVNSGLFLALKDLIEASENVRFAIKDCRESVRFNDDHNILSDRVYQNLCVRAMQRERSGGLVLSPTASGKTWIVGLYLVWAGHWYTAGWFHVKFVLVLAMSGLHGFFAARVRDFSLDKNTRSQKFYRIINEVVTLLMIGIVIMVIVKPF